MPSYCDLRTIPTGSTVFRVFATNKPKELGGKELLIGEVILTWQHSPEMPYALNLVKLGFLVLIPGASNWPGEELTSNWLQEMAAEQKPGELTSNWLQEMAAEQELHYWPAVPGWQFNSKNVGLKNHLSFGFRR